MVKLARDLVHIYQHMEADRGQKTSEKSTLETSIESSQLILRKLSAGRPTRLKILNPHRMLQHYG